MWGFGGRYYWRKKRGGGGGGGGGREGIVVAFAWMSSQERHLRNYVELYSSLDWDSLVCHSQFLNMFFPEKAAAIASEIVHETLKELKARPCPVVFASFSGGPKACMYKVLQMLDRTCETELSSDDCQLVRGCISGYIYDSSPVDFTSDLGSRFAIHPSVLKMSHPPKPIVSAAKGIASGLDALFLSRFESERAVYWQTLYASISMGAPYLILCSENDELAPYQIIQNFANRLEELGGDVKLVKWKDSPHVGHYRHHPDEYKAAVTGLLRKASTLYSQKTRRLHEEATTSLDNANSSQISDPIHSLREAAASGLQQSFKGTPLVTTDHFFLPTTSVEYYMGRDGASVQDEHKEGLIRLPSMKTDSSSPHGVLGQILFDVCVPKNVENWDVMNSSDSGYTKGSKRRQTPFNPMKCIRRSRL